MPELKIGTIVKDRYTLKEFKGSGSFGEVWLAHDEILDSNVAIKIYISLDPRGVEEFKSEYITTQGISHQNLLTTTYFDVWQQRPFLIMKYCAKGSSSALAGKMNEYALWQFIHDVAAGLNFLHNMPEPIIHQDIKPDNILVDDNGRYLITDFGISKKIRSTMRKQSKRAVGAGAISYMAPERFDSDPTPVKASDIWSLGVSIYELATGELPFSGLGGGMQRNGADMPSLGNKWSNDMTIVMQSCLAKETWNRPTAQQLEEYSDAIIKGQPAKVTWTSPTTHTNKIDADDTDTPEYETENGEEKHINKRGIRMIIGVIIVAIIIFLIWPSKKTEKAIDIPENNTESVDSGAVEVVEDTKSNVTEVEESKTIKVNDSRQNVPQAKKDKTKVDTNATILKDAIARGDYQQVQKFANHGYSAAYAPLAKYYLKNHDYKNAESYAQKAKSAGFSEGASILKTLKDLGYYDNK